MNSSRILVLLMIVVMKAFLGFSSERVNQVGRGANSAGRMPEFSTIEAADMRHAEALVDTLSEAGGHPVEAKK